MRLWNALLLCILLTACGRSETAAQDTASPQETVDRALSNETTSAAVEVDAPCALLEPIATELFIPPDTETNVREPTYSGNHLCIISWDIPGIDSEESTRRALSKELRYNNEISLTMMGTTYGSPEEAVASLESSVASLTEGVTVKAGGREHTAKTEFGDWIEGLGDRAIRKGNSILVATGGIRFTVAASLSDDPAENHAKVDELARRIIDNL
jgi:hypothetical protein